MTYLTMEEFKYSAEMTGYNFADGDIPTALEAASRGIDEYCGRRFFADADATSVRYYSPAGPYFVEIDDIVSCGTFATDLDGDGTFETVWTENIDFALEPLNAAADGKPFEKVRVLWPGSNRLPCWHRSVEVTGQFGWATVPGPVKQATSIMASRLLKRGREAPFGVVGFGLDNIAVRISPVDPDLRFLLEPYIRGGGVMVG